MKTHLFFKRLLLLWVFAFSASLWAQTATYDFAASGAVSGQTLTPVDANIEFASFKNSGTSTPVINTGQLRLYQNATKGGSIKIYAQNGATITSVVFYASGSGGTGPAKYSVDDGVGTAVTHASGTYTLNSLNATSSVEFYNVGSSSSTRTYVDKFEVTYIIPASGPTLTATPTTLSGFSYIQGSGPSAEQSFTVNGSDLTDDATVTAPANFEVSTSSGSGFGSSVNVAQSSGTIAPTTIYARMIAGLAVDTYSGDIVLSSTGATDVNVSLSGNVTPMPAPPVITAPSAQTGTVGVPYTYQIVASENPDSYAVTSGALPVGLVLNSTTGEISGTPATAGSYSATLTATNAAGTSAPTNFDMVIAKGTQTASLADFNSQIGDADETLPATTDEGLTITYSSSDPTVASIVGNTLTIGTVGTATITASNSGDANYTAFNETFTVTVATAPCGLEDFSNSALTNSYEDGSFVGNNGITWTYIKSRDANGSLIDGNAIMLRRSSDNSSIKSDIITTGIGNFSVKLYKGFTGAGARQVELFINGISKGTSTTFDDFAEHIFEVNDLNIAGNFTLELKNITGNQIIIDDISWTCYASNAITWDGSAWSNGTGPTSSDDAIIDGDYNIFTSFSAKKLTVNLNKTLIVNSYEYVDVVDVENNGTILVAHNANFKQTGSYTSGPGSEFKVSRATNDVQRLDYVSWSSPLKNSTQTLKDFSYGIVNPSTTGTLDNRFYKYNNGTFVSTPSSGTFETGQGYQIRTPDDFTTTAPGTTFHGFFEGVEPNTGSITYNASGITGDYVFLGNPYPSAISMADFLSTNNAGPSGISGTLYIWNSAAKMVGTAYTGPDNYISHNASGSNPPGSAFYVPVAQGFFVDRQGNTKNSFEFNDAMRSATATGTFAKSNVTDRFWLKMASSAGSPHMLFAFTADATTGLDNDYDGKLIENNPDTFYTKVNGEKMVIDAHGSFQANDSFDVYINSTVAKSYTISIAQKDGLFNNGGQSIYLKDKTNGTITDLTTGNYTFTSAGTGEENRFEVYFTNSVLATSNVVKEEVSIYGNQGVLIIESPLEIANVKVYDMAGRLILNKKGQGKVMKTSINGANIVVVNVEFQDGSNVSKKVKL